MKQIDIVDLGLMNYREAYAVQKETHLKRQRGEVNDTLIFVEHPSVITVGRAHKKSDIVNPDVLKSKKVPFITIDRGGGATCHGPGQIVIYPIIDLKVFGRDIRFYLDKLEAVFVELLNRYSLKARTLSAQRGIWVGDRKVVSIGIGISKWITFHGAALNVDMDMWLFSLIMPCGFNPEIMTSMCKLLNKKPDNAKIKKELAEIFMVVFNRAYNSKN
ncbi:MAG: lipoyl(octanoyl) transferase LipB [Candidatus Omnitrophica bacterium]|nr:lipoyl(octanoyl) transferase LipB [Candidatus Omnitrophota bacterium]